MVSTVDKTLDFHLGDKSYSRHKRRWLRLGADMKPELESDYPFDLLGNEGWKTMNPFVPIETSNYTEGELDVLIDFYTDKK